MTDINPRISKEFYDITHFDLRKRLCNYLTEGIERKDPLFSQLTLFYVYHDKDFYTIKAKIKEWLLWEESETIYALAAYIYYISENFKKAKKYFLKAIRANPRNFDNWIDLAFALRHLGEYKISNVILFDFDYVIHYYSHFNFKKCNYAQIKKMILKIKDRLKY